MRELLVGSFVATRAGFFILAIMPPAALTRLIGLVLLVIVGLEWLGLYPDLRDGGWGLGAGLAAGLLGGAIGTPGPPVILYAAAQDWSPRTVKANIQAFLIVNQAVILVGYWSAGLLDRVGWPLTWLYAGPPGIGLFAGMFLFSRAYPT